MKILIDNGHGYNTPGKCSPDKKLMEWQWTREIAIRVSTELQNAGYDANVLTPEIDDVPLKERVSRVNYWCEKLGKDNVCVVSIHNNATPPNDNKWHSAKGFSVFVSTNKAGKVSRGSAYLSDCFVAQAMQNKRNVRRAERDKSYWIKSLAITRDTLCPAVLSENYFMDNWEECQWLLSPEGKDECVRIHVEAIKEYVKSYQP